MRMTYGDGDANIFIDFERIGGLGGCGGPHLKSRGECALADLSAADRAAVDALFAIKGKLRGKVRHLADKLHVGDGFSYRISRQTATSTETIEVPADSVPAALASSVEDTLE